MNYTVKRSARRTIGLEITPQCEIIVRAPKKMSDKAIAEFVEKYRGWIDKKLPVAEKRAEKNRGISDREEELRQAARKTIPPLVEKYSEIMGLKTLVCQNNLRREALRLLQREKRALLFVAAYGVSNGCCRICRRA